MPSKLLLTFVLCLSTIMTSALFAQDETELGEGGNAPNNDSLQASRMDYRADEEWKFAARLDANYIFGGDVDNADGSLDVAIARLGASAWGPAWRGSQLTFAVSHEHSFYDFDFNGVEPFFGTSGDQNIEFNSVGASATLLQGFNRHWGALVQVGARASAEVDADLSDGVSWNVIAGIGYRHSEDFMIGVGLGFLGRLEEDLFIVPALQMRWRFAEDWTFRIQGRGAALVWDAQDDLQFTLGAQFAARRYRLNDDSVTNSGIFEDRRLPVSLNAAYRIDDRWRIDATIGVDVIRQLIVEDQNGNNRRTFDADPGVFFGLGVRATF